MQPLMGIESINSCDMAFASVHQKGESPFSGQALSVDLQAAERFTALLEEGHALTKEALNVCERRLVQSESPRQAFEPLLQSSALKMALPMEQQPALEQTSAEPESVSRHVPTTSVAPFAVESAVVKEAVTETPTRIPQCAEPPTTPHTTGFAPLAPQTASAPSMAAPCVADESPKAPLEALPDFLVKSAPSSLKAPVPTPSQPVLKTAVAFEQPKIVEQGSVRPTAPQGGTNRPTMTVEPVVQSELPKVAPQGVAATLPHGVEAQPNLRQPEGTAAVVPPAMPILQTVTTKQEAVAVVGERPVVAAQVISQPQGLPSVPQAIRTDVLREVAPQGGANRSTMTVEPLVQPELPKVAPQGMVSAVPQVPLTKQEAVASVGERPVVAAQVISQSQGLPSAPQAIRTGVPREVAPQGGANLPAMTVKPVVQPELLQVAPQGIASAVPQAPLTKQEAVVSVGERPVVAEPVISQSQGLPSVPQAIRTDLTREVAPQGGANPPAITVEPVVQPELPKVAHQGVAATLPHGVEAQPNLRQPEGTAAVVSPAMPTLQTVMTKQATVASVGERPVVAEPVISQSELPSAPQAIRTDLPREVAPQGCANPPEMTVEPVVQPELPKVAPQGITSTLPQGVEAQPNLRQPEGTAAVVSPAMPILQTVMTKQTTVAVVGERLVASPLTPEHEVASKVVYFRGRDVEGLSREAVQVIALTMLPITLPHQQVETIAQPIASHEVVQHFVMAAQAVADAMLVSSGFVRGEGQLLVRLRPEVLGGSEIRLVATEGTFTVIVHPATQDVQTLVEANRTQFEQYLAEKVTSWRLAVTVKRGGNDDERL